VGEGAGGTAMEIVLVTATGRSAIAAMIRYFPGAAPARNNPAESTWPPVARQTTRLSPGFPAVAPADPWPGAGRTPSASRRTSSAARTGLEEADELADRRHVVAIENE
jgi:hypothetical protein